MCNVFSVIPVQQCDGVTRLRELQEDEQCDGVIQLRELQEDTKQEGYRAGRGPSRKETNRKETEQEGDQAGSLYIPRIHYTQKYSN